MSGYWLTLDHSSLTGPELKAIRSMAALDAPTVQTTYLDINLQPECTVLVIDRPCEKLALVIRADGSIVVATDDVYAERWDGS